MAIEIPLTEKDWNSFAKKITRAGGKIRSRYIGVYAHKRVGRNWHWSAQATGEGKNNYLGFFPFTKEGEEAAKKAYEEYIADVPRKKIGNINKNKIR